MRQTYNDLWLHVNPTLPDSENKDVTGKFEEQHIKATAYTLSSGSKYIDASS